MRYDDVPYRHMGNEETGTVNANGKLPFALHEQVITCYTFDVGR